MQGPASFFTEAETNGAEHLQALSLEAVMSSGIRVCICRDPPYAATPGVEASGVPADAGDCKTDSLSEITGSPGVGGGLGAWAAVSTQLLEEHAAGLAGILGTRCFRTGQGGKDGVQEAQAPVEDPLHHCLTCQCCRSGPYV